MDLVATNPALNIDAKPQRRQQLRERPMRIVELHGREGIAVVVL